MRLVIIFFVFLWVFCPSDSYGQSFNGYFGKKNFIEILTVSSSPLVRNLLFDRKWPGYREKDGELELGGKYWLSSGIHVFGGRAIKNNFIIGVEYGLDRWKSKGISIPFGDYSGKVQNTYFDELIHEDIQMQRSLFMPKVEFSRSSGLLPMGLSYCAGLGISSVKVIEKDYLLAVTYESFNGENNTLSPLPAYETIESSDFIDYERRYLGLHLMGGIKMRVPVSTWLMISYGVRYMLDIKLYNTHGYSTNHYVSQRAASGTFANFISLDIGVTMPF